MTPSEILQSILKVNKPVARFLFAGLGLLAASAVVISWLGDNPGIEIVGLYILAFAALATLVAFVVSNTMMRLVLGWAMTSAAVLFMVGLVGAAVQVPSTLPVPACFVRILWEHPQSCEARLIKDEMVWAAPQGANGLWRAQSQEVPDARDEAYTGPIFLHYAPGNAQTAMVAVALALTEGGWPVTDAEAGGEEIARSPGTTQIRYFDAAAHDDAVALARAVKALTGAEGVLVRDFSGTGLIARDDLLEIWIAAPGDAT